MRQGGEGVFTTVREGVGRVLATVKEEELKVLLENKDCRVFK
jgi:hypothetical protein